MVITFESVRAEALFASDLQPSHEPSLDDVREAVSRSLRNLGTRGCVERVAAEYGDQPCTAAARMTWALAAVRLAYPAIPGHPVPAAGIGATRAGSRPRRPLTATSV
jgi:hypothetical protein